MTDHFPTDYSAIKVPESDRQSQGYKRHFGGGGYRWEIRGAFQLHLLEKMGLQPSHGFLDIGCGPLRGGAHIIKYLNAGMYQGIDYNADFIDLARVTVDQDPLLKAKAPHVQVLQNFDFDQLPRRCDFALAFSVLNHCAPEMRNLFFQTLPHALHSQGRVYITHAYWFDPGIISTRRLAVTRTLADPHDISPDLKMSDWGWDPPESIFPILELTKKD